MSYESTKQKIKFFFWYNFDSMKWLQRPYFQQKLIWEFYFQLECHRNILIVANFYFGFKLNARVIRAILENASYLLFLLLFFSNSVLTEIVILTLSSIY